MKRAGGKTIRYVTRSLTFCDVNGVPHLSLATTDGEHLHIELNDYNCILLNKQVAAFVSDRIAMLTASSPQRPQHRSRPESVLDQQRPSPRR